ncbi:MAG: hypothetical protein ACREMP_04240 [Candidatus Tyrphobacter sp.]
MLRRSLAVTFLFALLLQPATAFVARAEAVGGNALVVDRSDPLSISNVDLSEAQNGQIRLCFAYMNLTSRTVESAEFRFQIENQFGQVVYTTDVIDNSPVGSGNTIQPPDRSDPNYRDVNDGSQSCWLLGINNNSFPGIGSGSKVALTVVALRYDDGSTWRPGQQFPRAFAYDGTAYVYTPISFNTSWTTDTGTAPVAVVLASVYSNGTSPSDAHANGCVSYRNLTNKTATRVKFAFTFTDATGRPSLGKYARTVYWTDTGTFSPPRRNWNGLIDNHCWSDPLPASDVVRSMRSVFIQVEAVGFSDGSQWTRGQQWYQSFSADGAPLGQARLVAAGGGGEQQQGYQQQPGYAQQQNAPLVMNQGAGVVQIACSGAAIARPWVITIDETNDTASEVVTSSQYADAGQTVTAHAYFSSTEITWTWAVPENNGTVLQDSWAVNRRTLAASEQNGQYHYQCSLQPQNQI